MSYEIIIKFPEGMTEERAAGLARTLQFENPFLADAEIFVNEVTPLN